MESFLQCIHILVAAQAFTGVSAFAPFLQNNPLTPFLTANPNVPLSISSDIARDSRQTQWRGSNSFALSGLISSLISDRIGSKKVDEEAQEASWEIDLESRLEELDEYISHNDTFKTDLLHSLEVASKTAKLKLDPKLYQAFLVDNQFSWPTTIKTYFGFLTWFASYVPQQSGYEGWLVNGTTQDYNSTHQEVYDHLCHFYYLIDQPCVQDNEWFAEWLVSYAQVWGKFCNSPDSITPETIYSFYNNSIKFNVTDSMIPVNEEDIPGTVNKFTIYNDQGQPLRPNSPSGWMSWNQMFARELNPGLRPIDSPTNNSVICAPADCKYKATYPINNDNEVQTPFKIKRTHNIGNIVDLMKGSKYADKFSGGTYVHYFLGPYSYHRFHTPVAGVVDECFPVPGLTYLNVDIKSDGQFGSPDDSENGYEFLQARGLLTIDTSSSPYGNIGIVAVLPIGMCQVSSVSMIATPGATLEKGEEFGYFQFGGSDIIMLFQKGVVPKQNLIRDGKAYNHYGMQVGTAAKISSSC